MDTTAVTAKRRAEGRCTRCGRKNDRQPYVTCYACKDSESVRMAKRTIRRKTKNKCICCGRANDNPPAASCTQCATNQSKWRCTDSGKQIRKSWATEQRKNREAEGWCIRCGRLKMMGEETKNCRLCNEKGDLNFTWN